MVVTKNYSSADIEFKEMSEEEAVRTFQQDGYLGFNKRSMRYGPNLLSDSKWATAPARMFVALDGETPVAVCGIAKYKNILLDAGYHTRKGYEGRGLFGLCVQKILSEKGSSTIYVNVANPALVNSFRSRGFTDMVRTELPKELQEELEPTNYADNVQKLMRHSVNWFSVLRE
jgi:hypothetical protein